MANLKPEISRALKLEENLKKLATDFGFQSTQPIKSKDLWRWVRQLCAEFMELKKQRLNESPMCPNCQEFKQLMHSLGIDSSGELERSIQDLVLESKSFEGFERRLQTRMGLGKGTLLADLESTVFEAINRNQNITNN